MDLVADNFWSLGILTLHLPTTGGRMHGKVVDIVQPSRSSQSSIAQTGKLLLTMQIGKAPMACTVFRGVCCAYA